MSATTPAPAVAGLVNVLRGALQADAAMRSAAEHELAHLRTTVPEFGLLLVQVALTGDQPFEVRQLALLTLKAYTRTNWSSKTEQFEGPEPPLNIKQQIWTAIMDHGLTDANARVRVSSAYVIAKIAHVSWPDEWPDFLPSLLARLQAPHLPAQHGALCVLRDLVRDDLTDQHLPEIVRVILPHLLGVYTSATMPLGMKNRAMAIFRDLVELLYNAKEAHPDLPSVVAEMLPAWLDAMAPVLQAPAIVARPAGSDPAWDERATYATFRAKVHAYRAVQTVAAAFFSALKPHARAIVDFAWRDVTALAAVPVDELDVVDENDDSDEGGADPVSGETLVYACIDVLQRVLVKPSVSAAALFQDGFLGTLLPVLVELMRVPEEKATAWREDVNEYIAQELDEDAFAYSLRVAAQDLATAIIDKYDQRAIDPMRQVCVMMLQKFQTDAVRLEAAVALLGQVMSGWDQAAHVIESLMAVPAVTGTTDNIAAQELLRARVLRLMGQAADELPAAAIDACARFALQSLDATRPVMLVNAMHALVAIVNATHTTAAAKDLVQHPLMHAAGALVETARADSLVFLLETFVAALRIRPDAAAPHVPEHMARIVRVWQRSVDDPVVTALVVEVVDAMAASPAGLAALVAPAGGAPSTARLLEDMLAAPDAHEPGVVAAAVDMLAAILHRARAANAQAVVAPLVATTYAPLVALALRTDDATTIVAAQAALQAMVGGGHASVLASAAGLAPVVQVAARMLRGDTPEARAIGVGTLVRALVAHGGADVVAVLPDLLRAVAARLATAQTPSLVQGLVLVIAQLMHDANTYEPTVALLAATPAANGARALDVVLAKWTDAHEVLEGHRDIVLSAHVLAELFARQDPRMANVVVPGRTVAAEVAAANAAGGRRVTRSAAAKANAGATETGIPVFARILQLLVAELVQADSRLAAAEDELDGEDSEEWDEDDDDDEDGVNAGQFAYLSDVLDAAEEGGDRNDEADDDVDEMIETGSAWTQSVRLEEYLGTALLHALSRNLWDVQARAPQYLRQDQLDALTRLAQQGPKATAA
ncbi:hypothetical protein GGF31_001134 [Allomyces arbusculus]|nr:hypothetical protein GGF31_001134 [Allomyces arbusculus]